MRRRTVLSTFSSGVAAGVTGCVGFLAGNEALEREAAPAHVDDATPADTGYTLDGTAELETEETYEVAGQSRTMRAVNYLAEYHRVVDLAVLEAAEAAVMSTPAFEIAGEAHNPVADTNNRQLAHRIQDQYDDVEVGAEVDSRTVSTMGESMSPSSFDGEATFLAQGESLDVSLHVGSVRDDEAFVIVVAIRPRQLPGEAEHVRALVGGLVHEG